MMHEFRLPPTNLGTDANSNVKDITQEAVRLSILIIYVTFNSTIISFQMHI